MDESKHILDNIDPGVDRLPDGAEFPKKVSVLARATKAKERMRLFEDKAFYTTIIFQTSEQVEVFCNAAGITNADGSCYHIDGIELSERMGISLPKCNESALRESYSVRQKINWAKTGIDFFDETKGGGHNGSR